MALTLIIGNKNYSSWSLRPWIAMKAAGIAFDEELIPFETEDFRTVVPAMSGSGRVPVLVDDGEVVTQIVAILLHLDAKFPEAGILPAGGIARTRALSTLAWMNNTVHPTFTHVFKPGKFAGDEATQKAVRDFAVKAYDSLLDEIDALAAKASPWLCGEKPSALDAYALTLLRWGGFAGIDPTSKKSAWALAQRFAALPSTARVIEREHLELNVYKPAA